LINVLKISSFNSVTIFQPNKADIHTLTICSNDCYFVLLPGGSILWVSCGTWATNSVGLV